MEAIVQGSGMPLACKKRRAASLSHRLNFASYLTVSDL